MKIDPIWYSISANLWRAAYLDFVILTFFLEYYQFSRKS